MKESITHYKQLKSRSGLIFLLVVFNNTEENLYQIYSQLIDARDTINIIICALQTYASTFRLKTKNKN